ncbi:MAG: response regulator transcription factor [Rectinemataceae bacterium]
MIRTLIVDDEYLIRNLVLNSVDWAALGFNIVGEAEDGEEALRLIDGLSPRLLILDINIPLISGLELAFIVKEKHKNIKVLILTGHDEIDFVKQALRAGVADFLLKPLDATVLEKALSGIREEMEAEGKRGLVPSSVSPLFPSAASILDAFGGNPSESRPSIPALSGPTLPKGPFRIGAIEAAGPQEGEGRLRDMASVLEKCCGTLSPRFLRDGDRRLLAFFPISSFDLERGFGRVESACEAAISRLRDSDGIIMTIGLSAPRFETGDFPKACEEAREALSSRFHKGLGRLIGHGESLISKSLRHKFDRNSFLFQMRGGDSAAALGQVEGILEEAGSDAAPPHLVRMEAFEIAHAILEARGVGSGDSNPDEDFMSAILALETLSEIRSYLLALASSVEAAGERSTSRSLRIAALAKAQIEREFARKDLGLESIARAVSVSPGHLSSLFRSHTGLSVIECLTITRLEHAKLLMDDDPLSLIYDVADRSGYSDPYYFSKAFKKRFGVSPTKYLEGKAK